jgi:hypothetical protein
VSSASKKLLRLSAAAQSALIAAQPDLFMTPPPPYDLPPLQRTIVVKLLKVLLAEAR